MNIENLLKSKTAELTGATTQASPIVLSTRIRLARNLRDHCFPGRADEKEKQAILNACEEALLNVPSLSKPYVFKVGDLSDLDRQVLVERHLISRELSSEEASGAAVISKNQSFSVMINEEDHLRIQVLKNGFNFKKAWKAIDTLDSEIEEQLEYAFSTKLGYLTACPTNLGTGMRASVMMHLPALVMTEQMEKVVRAVNQLGLAVRGLFGEGSDAHGSIFQISNQQTLGESEEGIMKRLAGVLNTVIEQEHNARSKLLETQKLKLFDKIGRAFGLLKNAYYLNSNEAMNLLSLMRLGADLEMVDPSCQSLVNRLFIESQPGHIEAATQAQGNTEERDIFRARYLRDAFKDIHTLNFDNPA